MPQFKDPKNSALSGLNKAKKRVLKNEKIQYGQLQPDQVPVDDTFGAVASSAPKSRSSSSAGGVAGLLSELESLIGEVVQTNKFYVDTSADNIILDPESIPKATSVIKDVGPNATAIVNITKRLATILASTNYDFRSKLSAPELASASANMKSLSSMLLADDRLFRRADRVLRRDGVGDRGRVLYLDLIHALERVVTRWKPGLIAVYTELNDALKGARANPAMTGRGMLGADGHGIRHVESVFGGILNALRGDGELLTMGYVGRQPLIPLSQSHAPRNTMDHVNLPRRFL
jgi:hypothetical protein